MGQLSVIGHYVLFFPLLKLLKNSRTGQKRDKDGSMKLLLLTGVSSVKLVTLSILQHCWGLGNKNAVL